MPKSVIAFVLLLTTFILAKGRKQIHIKKALTPVIVDAKMDDADWVQPK